MLGAVAVAVAAGMACGCANLVGVRTWNELYNNTLLN